MHAVVKCSLTFLLLLYGILYEFGVHGIDIFYAVCGILEL